MKAMTNITDIDFMIFVLLFVKTFYFNLMLYMIV